MSVGQRVSFQLGSRNALTSHEIGKAGRRLAVEKTQEHFYPQILSALGPHRLGFGLFQ